MIDHPDGLMDYYQRHPHIHIVLDTHSTQITTCPASQDLKEIGKMKSQSESWNKKTGSSLRLWLLGQNIIFLIFLMDLVNFIIEMNWQFEKTIIELD